MVEGLISYKTTSRLSLDVLHIAFPVAVLANPEILVENALTGVISLQLGHLLHKSTIPQLNTAYWHVCDVTISLRSREGFAIIGQKYWKNLKF